MEVVGIVGVAAATNTKGGVGGGTAARCGSAVPPPGGGMQMRAAAQKSPRRDPATDAGRGGRVRGVGKGKKRWEHPS